MGVPLAYFHLQRADPNFFCDVQIHIEPKMKPTQPLARRISRMALNTKQTNKGYYKGTGTGSTGWHTKHGGYIIDWDKVRTYVVPKNLKDFKVYTLIWDRRDRR